MKFARRGCLHHVSWLASSLVRHCPDIYRIFQYLFDVASSESLRLPSSCPKANTLRELCTGESCLPGLVTIAQPSPPVSRTFGSDCAPALRHSTIIFCARTHGHCNQHDMGEGILE
jgi:hypothetical protein